MNDMGDEKRPPGRHANVFLIPPRLGDEDRFTAYWHYLLSRTPSLGQALLNYIAKKCNRESTRFLSAHDHPGIDPLKHPDFEIEGKDYSILFEHKLTAELGPLQLEKYLSLTRGRKRFLALVSSRHHSISPKVLAYPSYLLPQIGIPHFTWQEFSEILKKYRRISLVAEFVEFMEITGVTFQPWGRLGDPFVNPAAEKAIRDVLQEVAKRTRRKGCMIRLSRRTIGMQYRKPLPGIHLIYYWFSPQFQTFDRRTAGRTLMASVWIKHGKRVTLSSIRPVLSDAYGYLPRTEPRIFVTDEVVKSTWDPSVFKERCYRASLAVILGKDKNAALRNILDFITAVEANLTGHLPLTQETRPTG